MKKYFSIIIAVLSLAACSPVSKDCVAVCGGREVRIIDFKASEGTSVKEVWSWKLDDPATVLPEGYSRYLHHFDECKFVDGKRKLLLTSSGGGMVLLDIKKKEVLSYARVPMAHSADLLPGGRIAVALSTHKNGNALEIYDIDAPEKVVFRDSLLSGHGVVWNQKRQRLYALGYNQLREYKLKDWQTETPSLEMVSSWALPVTSGHDLSPVDDGRMLVTGTEGVRLFNIEDGTFSPFEPLKDMRRVKSVNYRPSDGRIVYTVAEESWWTHNVYQLNPQRQFTIDSLNIYKVRPAW